MLFIYDNTLIVDLPFLQWVARTYPETNLLTPFQYPTTKDNFGLDNSIFVQGKMDVSEDGEVSTSTVPVPTATVIRYDLPDNR